MLALEPKSIRKLILELVTKSKSSHIASCFSAVEIITTIYDEYMDENDVFLLSKGHAAAAWYSVLAYKGIISKENLLENYGKNLSVFMTHASHQVPGVAFSSGSLGMMSNVACGIGKAKKLKGQPGRVFVLLSDGELNEGSNWEAFMYAAHHKLDNITFIVDKNGLQSLTTTENTLNMFSLNEKFTAFKLDVCEVDGHNTLEISEALSRKVSTCRVVLANTVKGKGSPYIENKVAWHYKSPNDDEYSIILRDIDA